jgi:hypothetical protein
MFYLVNVIWGASFGFRELEEGYDWIKQEQEA